MKLEDSNNENIENKNDVCKWVKQNNNKKRKATKTQEMKIKIVIFQAIKEYKTWNY